MKHIGLQIHFIGKLIHDHVLEVQYCPTNDQVVGKLLYLTHTCPEISFATGLVARFMHKSHEIHWKVAKRILRYIRGTVKFKIHYSVGASPLLIGFTDSDWAGDMMIEVYCRICIHSWFGTYSMLL